MDFDVIIEDEISEYERLREKNMKALENMMSEFADDVTESISILNGYKQVRSNPIKKRRSANGGDSTFVFSGTIPLERRRSDRLLNVTPRYSYDDLIDEEDVKRGNRKYLDDISDLEKVIFRQKKTYPRKATNSPYVPVEQITDAYLKNVATRVIYKTYCPKNGSSCHQCRQKTLDSKTYCRSGRCIGVRGQFCGVCLKNRYGEDIIDALLNPKWECPPCRGKCNCSICRTREGKRPTGILAPLAFQYGHKSVDDFLVSLNGKGDYIEKPKKCTNKKHKKYDHNNECLIGFNQDLKPVWFISDKPLMLNNEGDVLLGFNQDKQPVMTKV